MKSTRIICLLLTFLLLCGCGKSTAHLQETSLPEVIQEPTAGQLLPPETIQMQTVPQETVADIIPEAIALSEEPAPAAPVIPDTLPSGTAVTECPEAVIDYSHMEDGYVMIRYLEPTERRLKVLIKGPTTTYNYNLVPEVWTVFPLSDGNGTYQIGIYKNVEGSRYSTVLTAGITVQLLDEFAPFLRPNQYVDYSGSSQTVATGLEITHGIEDPLMKVAAVYDYVVSNLEYDVQKAQTVQSGYLPVLDQILEEGKGICFDYAAVMTAMLRSQQIPCKLVVGYAGTVYHAWISVWTEESGWIDGAIFFDGHVWHRMDPTFASSSQRSEEIIEFIQNGNYTVKYLY